MQRKAEKSALIARRRRLLIRPHRNSGSWTAWIRIDPFLGPSSKNATTSVLISAATCVFVLAAATTSGNAQGLRSDVRFLKGEISNSAPAPFQQQEVRAFQSNVALNAEVDEADSCNSKVEAFSRNVQAPNGTMSDTYLSARQMCDPLARGLPQIEANHCGSEDDAALYLFGQANSANTKAELERRGDPAASLADTRQAQQYERQAEAELAQAAACVASLGPTSSNPPGRGANTVPGATPWNADEQQAMAFHNAQVRFDNQESQQEQALIAKRRASPRLSPAIAPPPTQSPGAGHLPSSSARNPQGPGTFRPPVIGSAFGANSSTQMARGVSPAQTTPMAINPPTASPALRLKGYVSNGPLLPGSNVKDVRSWFDGGSNTQTPNAPARSVAQQSSASSPANPGDTSDLWDGVLADSTSRPSSNLPASSVSSTSLTSRGRVHGQILTPARKNLSANGKQANALVVSREVSGKLLPQGSIPNETINRQTNTKSPKHGPLHFIPDAINNAVGRIPNGSQKLQQLAQRSRSIAKSYEDPWTHPMSPTDAAKQIIDAAVGEAGEVIAGKVLSKMIPKVPAGSAAKAAKAETQAEASISSRVNRIHAKQRVLIERAAPQPLSKKPAALTDAADLAKDKGAREILIEHGPPPLTNKSGAHSQDTRLANRNTIAAGPTSPLNDGTNTQKGPIAQLHSSPSVYESTRYPSSESALGPWKLHEKFGGSVVADMLPNGTSPERMRAVRIWVDDVRACKSKVNCLPNFIAVDQALAGRPIARVVAESGHGVTFPQIMQLYDRPARRLWGAPQALFAEVKKIASHGGFGGRGALYFMWKNDRTHIVSYFEDRAGVFVVDPQLPVGARVQSLANYLRRNESRIHAIGIMPINYALP